MIYNIKNTNTKTNLIVWFSLDKYLKLNFSEYIIFIRRKNL